MASLLLALAVLAACGGDEGEASEFAPVASTESAYCNTYRAWQVHELDGEGDDQADPAALEAYFGDYLEFNQTSLRQAPTEIRDEWMVSERSVRTVLLPVLRKYDFDVQRIQAEATPAEQAVAEPTPEVQKAQAAIHAYEDRVCGVATPPAADVVFVAGPSSGDYCAAQGELNGAFQKAEASRFDPKAARTAFTGDAFTEALDRVEKTAPDQIAADVEAEAEWYRMRWTDVFADYGYDIRRIWLDGTPEQRAVFTLSHPDVAAHAARTTAYEEQVCSG